MSELASTRLPRWVTALIGGAAVTSAYLLGHEVGETDSNSSSVNVTDAGNPTVLYEVYNEPHTTNPLQRVGVIDPSQNGFDIVCADTPTEGYPFPSKNTEDTYYNVVWNALDGQVIKGFIQARANMSVVGVIPHC